MNPVVEVEGLTKAFKLYRKPSDRLKEILTGRTYHRTVIALKDVSFNVFSSEIVGIVGQNGAGKSTLLKVLMKVLMPDAGKVNVNGRVTGLLELGTGFNYEFSGIDNIFFNGTFLGMSKDEISSKMDSIIAFAELGPFIYEPIKTYSSGMIMRLAFSIAIHADPVVFLVDEALSVGDLYFQQKCIRKIREFRESGGAIVFVSHDLNAVKLLCDRAILLDKGRIVEEGKPEDVVNTYNFLVARKTEGLELEPARAQEGVFCYGNQKVTVEEVIFSDPTGNPIETIRSGDPCRITVRCYAKSDVDDLTVGILFRDRFGQDIFGTSTFYTYGQLAARRGDRLTVIWDIPELNLGPGRYSLSVATHKSNVHFQECYHWMDRAAFITVVPPDNFFFVGLARMYPRVMVKKQN
ncbi:MAG: ABC transporter ATP-binding protein [Deltaproteobacteria bacterium]|nr:ABC transporter ATP-binding protein [Deltaproteobacteria bacterium]MBW2069281.1 ABC transporter ATP-binding protein [Deltaproteobacteria bacterium]